MIRRLLRRRPHPGPAPSATAPPAPGGPHVITWLGRPTLAIYAPAIAPVVARLQQAGRSYELADWSYNPRPGVSEGNPRGLPELFVTWIE